MFQTEHLQEKWQPVLEHPDLPKIEDSYKRAVTTLILENQEKALKKGRFYPLKTSNTNDFLIFYNFRYFIFKCRINDISCTNYIRSNCF